MSDSKGFFSPVQWHCGRYQLSIERPFIMGIINVTPDSFSGDGWHAQPFSSSSEIDSILSSVIESGADIIDIGGESTRPGSAAVSVQEECDRVLPFVERATKTGIPVSLDTSKPQVMAEAIRLGVSIINDVLALREEGALSVIQQSDVGVVLMHMQGLPRTMQENPQYSDVLTDVCHFLSARVDACVSSGVAPERLCIDPGIGYGKTLEHNLTLLSHVRHFSSFPFPILYGASRKSFLGQLLGRPVSERLAGTLATSLALAHQGVHIVRVHDVSAVRDAFVVWRDVMESPWAPFVSS